MRGCGYPELRIAAGQEQVWLVNSVGKIYKWNGSSWTQMQGSSARDVAVGNDGTIWCTNTDGAIFKWNGTGWTRLAGSDASRIAADAGSVWMVNTAGKLYRMFYGSLPRVVQRSLLPRPGVRRRHTCWSW